MPIITISRGAYSHGKEIAEKLAKKLGYECVSRDILLEASQHFNVPEVKLERALHDSPKFLDRFSFGKVKYISFIAEALLEHFQKDNIIYHGLAGHFFVRNISHVLKVRIIADFDDRVQEEMKRENISESKARQVLKKDDEERHKWSLNLYGIDTTDPSLYDIVLHLQKLSVDDAVDILADMGKFPSFQATKESKAALDDLVLAAKARILLVEKFPEVEVVSKDGVVHVNVKTSVTGESFEDEIKDFLKDMKEIKEIKTHIIP